MEGKNIKEIILEVTIASLDAQLKAVKRLQGPTEKETRPKRGMSQVDLVYDILRRSGKELHISEIISRVETIHGVQLERESIVSALAKKIKNGDRFLRVGRNIYTLQEEER